MSQHHSQALDGSESSDEAASWLRGRYRIERELGAGGQATTYLARDEAHDDVPVAIKVLEFDNVEQWKAVELFEREAEALERLDHPAIPDYIDSFHDEGDRGDLSLYLVQEYVEGRDLATRLAEGRVLDDAEITRLLDEMLDVLGYLHAHRPPVLHRDIKPANIIERPDGRFALVDFGAVQLVEARTQGGSTFIGTSGFVPREQMMGRAQPASDLYALGVTALQLMSGRPPVEMPMSRMRYDVTEIVGPPASLPGGPASPGMIELLEWLVEPVVEDRCPGAERARSRLTRIVATGHPEEDTEEVEHAVEASESRRRVTIRALELRKPRSPSVQRGQSERGPEQRARIRARKTGSGGLTISHLASRGAMQRLQEQRQSSSGDDDHTGVALIMGAVLFFAVVGGGFTQGPGLVFFMLVIGVILFVGASAMTSSNIETTHSERIVEFHASLELESSTYYWYSAGQRGRSNHGGSLDDLCRLRVSRSGGEDARTHFNLGLLTPEGSPKPLFEGLEWDEINHVLDHISVYLSLQGLRDVAVAFSARIDETIIDPEGRLLQPRDVEYEVFQA